MGKKYKVKDVQQYAKHRRQGKKVIMFERGIVRYNNEQMAEYFKALRNQELEKREKYNLLKGSIALSICIASTLVAANSIIDFKNEEFSNLIKISMSSMTSLLALCYTSMQFVPFIKHTLKINEYERLYTLAKDREYVKSKKGS